jgi:hypothetical protein
MSIVSLPWLGHAIELSAMALFAWCWIETRRCQLSMASELVVAVAYGWLLEVLDMLIFGTYHYGPGTWWWLADVPLYIPLLWATIVHSSMAISDRAGLPVWARPWLDGLLAVLIDLSVDAIAIRVGLWHWNIGLHEGWFGVPSGNLCAWMWVAFWYSAVTRLVRARIARGEPIWHRWLIPIVAYTGLFASLYAIGITGAALGLKTPDQKLWYFAVHVAVFLIVVAIAWRHRRPDGSPVLRSFAWNRRLIHAAFFAVLVGAGLWRHEPALIAVSLGAMAIEATIFTWAEPARL